MISCVSRRRVKRLSAVINIRIYYSIEFSHIANIVHTVFVHLHTLYIYRLVSNVTSLALFICLVCMISIYYRSYSKSSIPIAITENK